MTLEWLKHAFATDPPGPARPTEVQQRIVDRICHEIVGRRLTMPAQMALEMGRPLNYMSAQLLHFFQPFATVLTDAGAYEEFTTFLEQRGAVDYISARLDEIESANRAAEARTSNTHQTPGLKSGDHPGSRVSAFAEATADKPTPKAARDLT